MTQIVLPIWREGTWPGLWSMDGRGEQAPLPEPDVPAGCRVPGSVETLNGRGDGSRCWVVPVVLFLELDGWDESDLGVASTHRRRGTLITDRGGLDETQQLSELRRAAEIFVGAVRLLNVDRTAVEEAVEKAWADISNT